MSRARDLADRVLHNRTHEDTDGGRESILTFKGEQSGGEISTLAQIQASHDGTSDDEKADLIFKTNDGSDGASPTEAMRITSQQRLGLGTDDPSDDFEIKPSADEKGITLKTTDSIRPYLNFDANRSGANQQVMRLQGKWNGNTITRFETSTGDDTSNKDNGYFTFQTATSSSDLNTRVRIDEHGIKFGSDTAEANGLHDYEEGTFTPTWSGYPTGFAGTEGRYTKIGNTVTVHVQLVTGTSADYSGVGLDNLPFTAANVNGVGSGMAWCDNTTFYDFKTATNVVKNTTTCALNMVNGGAFTSMEYVGRTPQLGASGTFQWTIVYQAA